MANATHHKYMNLYTCNRNRNDLFDTWLKDRYEITEGKDPWNYGCEYFRERKSGDRSSEAKAMQAYVKEKRPYFKDMWHVEIWCDSPYETQEEFFAHDTYKGR